MSASTPIYGLSYPTGSDTVATAPAQFKSLAETVETALAEVDARATPEGSTPVVRQTLAQLATVKGVTGQIGYVTSDKTAANIGPYVWTGQAWEMLATLNQITQGYRSGSVIITPTGTSTEHTLFTADSWRSITGREIDEGNPTVVIANGDARANPVGVIGASYNDTKKAWKLVLNAATGSPLRINYVIVY